MRSVRKSICLRSSYRPSDEGARSVQKGPRANTFPYRPNEVNKEFVIWLLAFFLLLLAKLCVRELAAYVCLLVFSYFFVDLCRRYDYGV